MLRMVLSEIKNKEIEKRAAGPSTTLGAGPFDGLGAGKGDMLDDAEVTDVLRREVKKRKDAVELFKKGNRPDLAASDEADIVILNGYLPALMSREDIEKVVAACAAAGAKDLPSLMRESMKQLKGKADGALVAEVVRARI